MYECPMHDITQGEKELIIRTSVAKLSIFHLRQTGSESELISP